MEILASLREKGASRVRVRRCPKWTTSTTPVGLPAHAAFAGRIEKCRADCRQNHQEAFPGDGDVALLCYPTSISPSSTRDPESAEAGRGTRFLCVSRSRSRDRSHYCCGRSPGALARWAEALAPARQSSRQRHAGGDERTSSNAAAGGLAAQTPPIRRKQQRGQAHPAHGRECRVAWRAAVARCPHIVEAGHIGGAGLVLRLVRGR